MENLVQNQTLIYMLVFFFGASIGSFINVLIDRSPLEGIKSYLMPSFCFTCKTRIKVYHLIPIFSYIALKGRCRNCNAVIPFRNFLVEVGIAMLAMALFYLFNGAISIHGALESLYIFLLISISIMVIIIDLIWWIIPIGLSVSLVLLSVIFNIIVLNKPILPFALGFFAGLIIFGLSMVIVTLSLRNQGKLSQNETALGLGDIWLIAAIGANVGVINLFWVMFLAGMQGIIAWLITYKLNSPVLLNLSHSSKVEGIPDEALPFGVFLALALIEISLIIL